MKPTITLGQRALREAIRQPDALFMTMFIPLFFLVVNTGQAAEIFPSESTDFLKGQGYGAFQLPITLLLAASFGMAALFLVEEIEGGYFDKLRAIPIPRYSIVLGRLVAEGAKGIVLSTVIVLLALPFGITIASGPAGFVLLVALTALWGVVYAGFMQLIALKTRSAAAVNSGGLIFFPLLFLTPNFVPRDLLTEPMEIAATVNPVTYLMEALRSLILDDLDWGKILPGFAVIAALGAVMLVLNVRMIERYDWRSDRKSRTSRLGAAASHASVTTSSSRSRPISGSRTRTIGYPSKCGVVKKTPDSSASSASLAIRCSTFAPRIGPPGASSPSAATSLLRSGRSQTNSFLRIVHALLPPKVVPSSACGRASAIRLTVVQVATASQP